MAIRFGRDAASTAKDLEAKLDASGTSPVDKAWGLYLAALMNDLKDVPTENATELYQKTLVKAYGSSEEAQAVFESLLIKNKEVGHLSYKGEMKMTNGMTEMDLKRYAKLIFEHPEDFLSVKVEHRTVYEK